MILTPLEARVRATCLALLAVGLRPVGPELAARFPARGRTDLIRIRNRLIARGELPATAGKPPVELRLVITEADRVAVIAYCRELVADGVNPSVDRLRRRFRGLSHRKLVMIRGEAIEAGLIKLMPAGTGLLGRTDKELAEVEERTEKIRREKIDRGEVPRPVELRVVKDRRPTSRRTIGRA